MTTTTTFRSGSSHIIFIYLLCYGFQQLPQHASSFVVPKADHRGKTAEITTTQLDMTWHQTWKNILVEAGPKRWKVDDRNIKQQAIATIHQYASRSTAGSRPASSTADAKSLNILCPLAGDDPFVHEAWLQGHSVTSIDLVPDAVDAMRKHFDDDASWTKDDTSQPKTTIWKHSSGRATLCAGDMLQKRPEFHQQFDVVYDKDSFGALDKDMRSPYCQRLAEFLKDDGIVYTEVKHKEDPAARSFGPPFHIEKDDLMEPSSFGTEFEYIDGLGNIYDLGMPGMSQTAHVLKRTRRSR